MYFAASEVKTSENGNAKYPENQIFMQHNNMLVMGTTWKRTTPSTCTTLLSSVWPQLLNWVVETVRYEFYIELWVTIAHPVDNRLLMSVEKRYILPRAEYPHFGSKIGFCNSVTTMLSTNLNVCARQLITIEPLANWNTCHIGLYNAAQRSIAGTMKVVTVTSERQTGTTGRYAHQVHRLVNTHCSPVIEWPYKSHSQFSQTT